MSDNLKEREELAAFDAAVESARLLGAADAKRCIGVFTAEDARFVVAMHQSIAAHRAAIEASRAAVPAGPPFGSKRNAALALYRPPFKFMHGYVYDADGKMCADEGAMPEHVAARVRGWGRIGYMPDAEALQDEVGQVIAEALTTFWLAAAPQPVAQPGELAKPMTAHRAAYFMRRFLNEEKLLGPNEQAALRFAIAALESV